MVSYMEVSLFFSTMNQFFQDYLWNKTSVLEWVIILNPSYPFCCRIIYPGPFAIWFCSIFYYWCWIWPCDLVGQWNVRCDGSRGVKCIWVLWLHLLSFCHCQNETCDKDLNLTCVLEPSSAELGCAQTRLDEPDEISRIPVIDPWESKNNGCYKVTNVWGLFVI